MRFLSRSDRTHDIEAAVSYDSVVRERSKTLPGVSFAINRISFGRRMELTRRVREISQKAEFLQAGTDLKDKIEANILAQEIEAMYLRWGLIGIDGLAIDGEPATLDKLLEKGPDELTREIVGAIKTQCGLSETERKN
jgi:hypothetical protein